MKTLQQQQQHSGEAEPIQHLQQHSTEGETASEENHSLSLHNMSTSGERTQITKTTSLKSCNDINNNNNDHPDNTIERNKDAFTEDNTYRRMKTSFKHQHHATTEQQSFHDNTNSNNLSPRDRHTDPLDVILKIFPQLDTYLVAETLHYYHGDLYLAVEALVTHNKNTKKNTKGDFGGFSTFSAIMNRKSFTQYQHHHHQQQRLTTYDDIKRAFIAKPYARYPSSLPLSYDDDKTPSALDYRSSPIPPPPMYIGHHHQQHHRQQTVNKKSSTALIYQCTEEGCSCTSVSTTTANNDVNNNNDEAHNDVIEDKNRQHRSYLLETRKRTLDAAMMGGHVISAHGKEGASRADNIMTPSSSKIRDAHADYLTYLKSVKELKKIEKMNSFSSANNKPFKFGGGRGDEKKSMVSV